MGKKTKSRAREVDDLESAFAGLNIGGNDREKTSPNPREKASPNPKKSQKSKDAAPAPSSSNDAFNHAAIRIDPKTNEPYPDFMQPSEMTDAQFEVELEKIAKRERKAAKAKAKQDDENWWRERDEKEQKRAERKVQQKEKITEIKQSKLDQEWVTKAEAEGCRWNCPCEDGESFLVPKDPEWTKSPAYKGVMEGGRLKCMIRLHSRDDDHAENRI
jgi:hypothetical protein